MLRIHALLVGLIVLAVLGGCSQEASRVQAPEIAASDTEEGIGPLAQAVQRPFSDYTSTQGTFCFPDGSGGCIDFEPPVRNFIGWSEHEPVFNALFEYLGNADQWLQQQSGGSLSLGTEITGTVKERPLPGGRAEIHITVHARNILAWMTHIESYVLDPLVFGYRVTDVLAGAPPSLGDFHMNIRFIVPEQNAPIPDLFQLIVMPEPEQELLHLSVNMSAVGILHEGSGYPEGTLGLVRVVQVYPPLPNSTYGTGWAVERIDIQPI